MSKKHKVKNGHIPNRSEMQDETEQQQEAEWKYKQPGAKVDAQTIVCNTMDTKAQDREIESMAESGYQFIESYALPGLQIGLRFIRRI